MKLFSIVMILILLKNLMMNFKFYYKCYKEFRKLLKKYRTLSKDLERFYKSLFSVNFKENKKFAILCEDNDYLIIKARLFCQTLTKNTLRIIFVYYQNNEILF